MAVHRVRADHELRRDLAVIQSVRDERKYFALSGGQKDLRRLAGQLSGLGRGREE
jgi:hypothetical protein